MTISHSLHKYLKHINEKTHSRQYSVKDEKNSAKIITRLIMKMKTKVGICENKSHRIQVAGHKSSTWILICP